MKSILIVLLLSIFVSSYADDKTYPACEQNSPIFEIIKNKRYFNIGLTPDAYVLGDERTIQIDKKNKTIKVWLFELATAQGKENIIIHFGKHHDLSNQGASRSLKIFDYKNMRIKTLKWYVDDCYGTNIFSLIFSLDVDNNWQDIIPASSDEYVLDMLMKKYKLQ